MASVVLTLKLRKKYIWITIKTTTTSNKKNWNKKIYFNREI